MCTLHTCFMNLLSLFLMCPQKAYIFTFLLSSRLFIEPRELLARVCHLCIEQQQLDQPVLDKVRGERQAGGLLTTPTFPRQALGAPTSQQVITVTTLLTRSL